MVNNSNMILEINNLQYYGGGGGDGRWETNKNENLGENIKKEEEKRRKIT